VIVSVEVFLTRGTLELQPIHQVWNWQRHCNHLACLEGKTY